MMSDPLQEIEGTWEEIVALGPHLAGRRLKLILLDTDDVEDAVLPHRPAPTPEQATLGIMPAAIGNGTYADIMRFVHSQPPVGDKQFQAFEQAIADSRALRRQLARERED
jgi:hypothetical protein